MNTYNRLPVVFKTAKGAVLTDIDDKEYLDFGAGIAVNCLGHGHPSLVKAVQQQAASMMHICNFYQSDVSLAFARALVESCSSVGMKKVFLGNSGAEANEGAVKIARKYSLLNYGNGRYRIVTLRGSFHGRTITTLAATGQDHFHKDFGPFTEGFAHIPAGDIKALDQALDGTVCAFMLEPVQGESGIRPQDSGFVKEAAALCRERDVLLVFDEIQSGIGRTGRFLACEEYGIPVDIVTLAKGLAGGLPIGAVLAGEKVCDVMVPGDHGSTFGGNPLASAAALAVVTELKNSDIMAENLRKGQKIEAIVKGWKLPAVRDIRVKGLMIGIDIDRDARPVLEAALAKGLLILSAGQKTLRLLPPYIISDEELERGLDIVHSVLKQEE